MKRKEISKGNYTGVVKRVIKIELFFYIFLLDNFVLKNKKAQIIK